jgi:hypothetical protein
VHFLAYHDALVLRKTKMLVNGSFMSSRTAVRRTTSKTHTQPSNSHHNKIQKKSQDMRPKEKPTNTRDDIRVCAPRQSLQQQKILRSPFTASKSVQREGGRKRERERANSTRPKGVCTRETKGLNYRCNLDLARQSEGSFLLPCQI